MKNRAMIISALLVLILSAPLVYILSQQPKLSLNSQQFGLMLLKGRYRSWFLSWSDGFYFDDKGRRQSVVIGPDGAFRDGYRIVPRLSHMDMRDVELQSIGKSR